MFKSGCTNVIRRISLFPLHISMKSYNNNNNNSLQIRRHSSHFFSPPCEFTLQQKQASPLPRSFSSSCTYRAVSHPDEITEITSQTSLDHITVATDCYKSAAAQDQVNNHNHNNHNNNNNNNHNNNQIRLNDFNVLETLSLRKDETRIINNVINNVITKKIEKDSVISDKQEQEVSPEVRGRLFEGTDQHIDNNNNVTSYLLSPKYAEIPRVLFFGGDEVSVTALALLCSRMKEKLIMLAEIERSNNDNNNNSNINNNNNTMRNISREENTDIFRNKVEVESDRDYSVLAGYIEVVCPTAPIADLPNHKEEKENKTSEVNNDDDTHTFGTEIVINKDFQTPSLISDEDNKKSTTKNNNNNNNNTSSIGNKRKKVKYSHEQYPVARFCITHGIPFHVVDHPKSLSKSTLDFNRILNGTNHRPGIDDASIHSKNNNNNNNNDNTIKDITRNEGYCKSGATTKTTCSFDITVIVSFRYFIPDSLLERLPFVINIHPSLLPKYRGASPIFTTLMRGDTVGGCSIIKLMPRENMDSGDVILQKPLFIPPEMDIRGYFPAVVKLGSEMLCELLDLSPKNVPSNNNTSPFKISSVLLSLSPSSSPATPEWKRHFLKYWNAANPQTNKIHFKQDPFYAPIISSISRHSNINWSDISGQEAFGLWRAFVGGRFFRPVSGTLDKGTTPVSQQLLSRALSKYRRNAKKKKNEDIPIESVCGGNILKTTVTFSEAKSLMLISRETLLELDNIVAEMGMRRPRDVGELLDESISHISKELNNNSTDDNMLNNINNNISDLSGLLGTSALPPGSAYFPKSDESICAVWCARGKTIESNSCIHELDTYSNITSTNTNITSNSSDSSLNEFPLSQSLSSGSSMNPRDSPLSASADGTLTNSSPTTAHHWFFWSYIQVHSNTSGGSGKPIPAKILRHSLALKAGVVYEKLFTSE